MRGSFRDVANRDYAKRAWRDEQIPLFLREEVAPLVPLVKRRDNLVAIDIGANKGFWTKAFLECFKGRVERVYMVDASPENHRELAERDDSLLFDPQDFPLISAHHFAAGTSNGTVTLYTNDDGSPLASLYKHEEWAHYNAEHPLKQQITVPMRTLDGFVAEYGIGFVDILKIDTEGHEFDVLEGARDTLNSGQIGCVFYEFGMHHIESRRFFVDFYKMFKAAGYTMVGFMNGEAHVIANYDYQFENFTTLFNYAAVRSDLMPSWSSELKYLADNKDVAAALRDNKFESALQHFEMFGKQEGRVYGTAE